MRYGRAAFVVGGWWPDEGCRRRRCVVLVLVGSRRALEAGCNFRGVVTGDGRDAALSRGRWAEAAGVAVATMGSSSLAQRKSSRIGDTAGRARCAWVDWGSRTAFWRAAGGRAIDGGLGVKISQGWDVGKNVEGVREGEGSIRK